MTAVLELMRFGFVQRALAAGLLIALGCAVLGVFLVLRRHAMIGDGLSHVAFAAVGLALCLDWTPLWVALPLVTLASLVIFKLPERTGMFGDAAIGMVAATGVAVGVMLASLGGGFNVDLFGFLFGDILSVSVAEIGLATILTLGILLVAALNHYPLMAITMDPGMTVVWGLQANRLNRLLAVLTAMVVVLGIRMAGTLLVSGLLIFPAVSAMQFGGGFRMLVVRAGGFGILSVIVGVPVALALDTPVGPMIILTNAAVTAASLLFNHVARSPA